MQEVRASSVAHTIECALFYLSAPRTWLRITASITITRQSKYWKFIRARSPGASAADDYNLPISLNMNIASVLAAHSDLVQDSHLEVVLENENSTAKSLQDHALGIQLIKQPEGSRSELQEQLICLTESLAHSGLAWYNESQLDMRPLRRNHKPDYLFLAWLESRWVLACRFGSGLRLPSLIAVTTFWSASLVSSSNNSLQIVRNHNTRPSTRL